MKAIFNKPYRFAENSFSFIEFEAGQEYEVSQSCADSARQSGFIDDPDKQLEPGNVQVGGADLKKEAGPAVKQATLFGNDDEEEDADTEDK